MVLVSRPRGGGWLEDDLAYLVAEGVSVLVSALETREAEELDLTSESDVALKSGLRFISFAFPDRGVPPDPEDFRALCRELWGSIEERDVVAVHCRLSVGRAPMIAIGTLMAGGVEFEAAVDAVSSARGMPVPETTGQREWLASKLRGGTWQAPPNW